MKLEVKIDALEKAIDSFRRDPPNSAFQRGYLSALIQMLRVFREEAALKQCQELEKEFVCVAHTSPEERVS